MSISSKVICDICKNEIRHDGQSESREAIAVVGDVHVVKTSELNGVGGGLFGGTEKPQTHHFHIMCLKSYLEPTKR